MPKYNLTHLTMPTKPVVKVSRVKNTFSRSPQAYRAPFQSQEKSIASYSVGKQLSEILEVNIGSHVTSDLGHRGALQSLRAKDEDLAQKSTHHSRLLHYMYPIRRSAQLVYV